MSKRTLPTRGRKIAHKVPPNVPAPNATGAIRSDEVILALAKIPVAQGVRLSSAEIERLIDLEEARRRVASEAQVAAHRAAEAVVLGDQVVDASLEHPRGLSIGELLHELVGDDREDDLARGALQSMAEDLRTLGELLLARPDERAVVDLVVDRLFRLGKRADAALTLARRMDAAARADGDDRHAGAPS